MKKLICCRNNSSGVVYFCVDHIRKKVPVMSEFILPCLSIDMFIVIGTIWQSYLTIFLIIDNTYSIMKKFSIRRLIIIHNAIKYDRDPVFIQWQNILKNVIYDGAYLIREASDNLNVAILFQKWKKYSSKHVILYRVWEEYTTQYWSTWWYWFQNIFKHVQIFNT